MYNQGLCLQHLLVTVLTHTIIILSPIERSYTIKTKKNELYKELNHHGV